MTCMGSYPPEIRAKAQQIKLLAMDVDGVLTDGQIIYSTPLVSQSSEAMPTLHETKAFNVKDGHGIAMLSRKGFSVALITARSSAITTHRATELGIQHVFQGAKRKLETMQQLATQLGLGFEEIAYIGDDWPDEPVLRQVGLACCPADAAEAIQAICHIITQHPGGRGAVREITDLLAESQKLL